MEPSGAERRLLVLSDRCMGMREARALANLYRVGQGFTGLQIDGVDVGDQTLRFQTTSITITRNSSCTITATQMAPVYLKRGEAKKSSTVKSAPEVSAVVKDVIDNIRLNGDKAVREYSEKFDKWSPPSFKLSKEDIQNCISAVDPQIVQDIKKVQYNIRKFAQAQRDSLKDFEIEMEPGVYLGQRSNPIDAVGT